MAKYQTRQTRNSHHYIWHLVTIPLITQAIVECRAESALVWSKQTISFISYMLQATAGPCPNPRTRRTFLWIKGGLGERVLEATHLPLSLANVEFRADWRFRLIKTNISFYSAIQNRCPVLRRPYFVNVVRRRFKPSAVLS